jgi:hypothetical protein
MYKASAEKYQGEQQPLQPQQVPQGSQLPASLIQPAEGSTLQPGVAVAVVLGSFSIFETAWLSEGSGGMLPEGAVGRVWPEPSAAVT